MTGESPRRPGILKKRPRCRRRADDVAAGGDGIAVDRAVGAEVFGAELLDVPADIGVLLFFVAPGDPVVLVRKLLFPVEPDLPAALGQEVLFFEAVGLGELQGPGPDEKDAVGALHDEARHLRRVLDALERADGARLHRAAVHDGSIELHDALFVRDAAVADRHVIGIVLDDVDARDDGVQRIAPRLQNVPRLLDRLETVCRRDDDGPCGRGPRRSRLDLGCNGKDGSLLEELPSSRSLHDGSSIGDWFIDSLIH